MPEYVNWISNAVVAGLLVYVLTRLSNILPTRCFPYLIGCRR